MPSASPVRRVVICGKLPEVVMDCNTRSLMPKSLAPERTTHWVLLAVALFAVVFNQVVLDGLLERKVLPPVTTEAST